MTGISEGLIRTLVTYMKTLGRRPRIEGYKSDVLDYAYENLKFDGDEDDLWAAVMAAVSAGPLLNPGQQSAGGRVQEDPVKPPPLWDKNSDQDLVTAPYRFTPVNASVSRLRSAPTPLDKAILGHLSCVIDVDWAVETPLLIGEPDKDGKNVTPFKLGDDFAIPGATLRGAMRSVMEVLGFARMFQINRHQRFGLRNFEHPYYKDYIKRELSAGWLQNVDGSPHITPCDWGFVEIEQLLGSKDHKALWDWAGSQRAGKYAQHKIRWQNEEAFAARRGFSFLKEDNGRKIYKADGGKKSGRYVFSGAIPLGGAYSKDKNIKKRFEYAFFDTPAAPVSINDATWDRFEVTHCKPSQNKRKPDGAWAEFADSYANGGKVPVFYSGRLTDDDSDPDFSFGLTRLYRIPHRYSIGQMLLRCGEAHRPAELVEKKLTLQPDFVEHLFGYVYEPEDMAFGHLPSAKTQDYSTPDSVSRKGRLAFGFARSATKPSFKLWPDEALGTVLGAPKPSFGPFYLIGPEKDYSADINDFPRLAGRKRYIVRRKANDMDLNFKTLETALRATKQGVDANTSSNLRFLVPTSADAVFRGRIKGHNLSDAELGGLLWALGFGGDRDARHQFGRGKAFGAGQVLARRIVIHIRRNGGGAVEPDIEWIPQTGSTKVKDYLDAFVAAIAGLTGQSIGQWQQSAEVKALLNLARPRGWSEKGTGYLPFTPVGGRPAASFSQLRKSTRLGAALHPQPQQPPAMLLKP